MGVIVDKRSDGQRPAQHGGTRRILGSSLQSSKYEFASP